MIADRYELKELLGRGAMGEVRRAFDHVTGHDVALALAPESDPLRFQERGRALVRLRHPGLVPVLDHGMADAHTGYLVMAIVPGHLHAHGPVPAEEACRILAGLARALAVLHARGYVHRDVKAANVRITPDGSPVLLDFGLVAPAGEAADGKAVTGTPAYLAPEAIAGGVITAATDLYALGCLAYELLTGHPPFAGTPAEVLRAQLHAPPPPLAAPPELVAVVAALLRKAPGDRPPDAQAVAILLEAAGDLEPGDELEGPPQLATERLVGREQELATLADALRDVLAGQGRAVIVAAPPGVGKSRLVQEAVWAARREDVEAVAARCRPDAAEPLQAVTEIWGPVEAGHDKASFHAELARRLAERAPLLVVVDDLQWGDAASLEAINACMRLLANERVLWLATLRPEEAPPGHGAWHAAEEGLATVLRLAPLTRDRADALLAALLHPADLPPSFARMVHETTGGNAFFVGETLRHLVEEGLLVRRRGQWRLARELVRVDLPEAAEAAVLRRAANLPPESAALLRLAAVLGPAPLREVLARASGLPDDAYLAAVEPLLERQFLVAGEQGYRLPHDRLREAVYGAIPAGTRRELHQRCGAALEPLDPGPAVLAHHFLRAGDAARGQRYALAAGEHYRAAGMPARALAVWQEAADLPEPPAELWWLIGSVGFELRPDLATAALDRLLAGDTSRAVEAEAFLASAHGFGGRPRLGLAAAQRAYDASSGMSAPMRAAALMVRGPSLLSAGRIDELVAAAREAAAVLAPLDPAGQPAIVRAARVGAISYQIATCYQGDPPPPGQLDAALEAARQAGAVNLFLTIRHYEALAAALTGRLGPAQAYIDWAGPYGRRSGAPPHPWLLYLSALVPFQQGNQAQARAAIERAYLQPGLALAGAIRHQVDVLSARLERNVPAAQAALAEAEAEGLLLGELQAHLALGELATAAGDFPAARTHLEAALHLAVAGEARNPLYEAIALRYSAELALAEGDGVRALALAEQALQGPDNPLEAARLHRLMGEAHLKLGDESGAAAAWRQAVAAARAIDHAEEARLSEARIQASAAEAAAVEERWAYLEAVLPQDGRFL